MRMKLETGKIRSDRIKKVEEISCQNVYQCYQCGKCSAACPAGFWLSIRPTGGAGGA